MRILITGAYGMLGTDLQKILKDEDIIATGRNELDITDLNKINEFLNENSVDIIINSAAMTDVDGCEFKEEIAYKLNEIGPKNLAIACKEYDIPLVHISTDYVFKGEKREPLLEDDEIGPETVYGKSKLKGEIAIKEILDKYFILRTAWLYGLNGPNFVEKMLELAQNHDEISVVNDQVGSPTYTVDLAIAISEIIKTNKYGTYHVTNSGSCTWFDYAKLIFKESGIDVKVKAVSSEEFAAPAKRPNYSVLSHEKWINNGFKELRNYKEALKSYLSSR